MLPPDLLPLCRPCQPSPLPLPLKGGSCPTHAHHPFTSSQWAHSCPAISLATSLKPAGRPGPPLDIGSCHTIFFLILLTKI